MLFQLELFLVGNSNMETWVIFLSIIFLIAFLIKTFNYIREDRLQQNYKNEIYELNEQINEFKNNDKKQISKIEYYQNRINELSNTVSKQEKYINQLEEYLMPTPELPPTGDLTQEMKYAFEQIKNASKQIIFIHGSAGTGKTTFLNRLQQNKVYNNTIYLAYTGIAATHINGSTIHSFFNIPPVDVIQVGKGQYSNNLFEKLSIVDLIVIDEISMVRADLMDEIDYELRQAKKNHLPFGGVKMLLVGDLYQLPPILKNKLSFKKAGYDDKNPYFFASFSMQNAIKQDLIAKIEFTTIFRQSDKLFISVLQKCRKGNTDPRDIKYLNKQVMNSYINNIIVLATTNEIVDSKNEEEYNKLTGVEFKYKGILFGNFPKNNLPAPADIKLKAGAQVLILANEENYKNGNIGIIISIQNNSIKVKIPSENNRIVSVFRHTWEFKEYVKENGSLVLKTTGSYEQMPLKLGWAVTIHKAQGLTLDSAIIDFGDRTFAAGQGYVGVSRVKTLDGLHFTRSVKSSDFFTSSKISEFLE